MSSQRAAFAILALLCALTAWLAVGFAAAGDPAWERAGPPLLAGTCSLFAAVALHAVLAHAAARAALFFSLALLVSYAAEAAGTSWGWPFGARYSYHPALLPRLPGGVPLFIPLSWAVIAYLPLVILREGRDAAAPAGRRRALRTIAATAMLVATDLYLDPLAVSAGAWSWEAPGPWFGVPLANFGGWGVVGLAVYGGYFFLEGRLPATGRRGAPAGDRLLVATAVFLAAAAHAALARRVPGGARVLLVTLPLSVPPLAAWLALEVRGPRGTRAGRGL